MEEQSGDAIPLLLTHAAYRASNVLHLRLECLQLSHGLSVGEPPPWRQQARDCARLVVEYAVRGDVWRDSVCNGQQSSVYPRRFLVG